MGLDLERSLDWAELDAFVAAAPGATFYHGSAWLRSLQAACAHEIGFLTWRETHGLEELAQRIVDKGREAIVRLGGR